ncbi:MAG TPA: oxygenase MpaB family protein [Rhodanobacteraceae bacterium]|nr:oxygenase MpaB family protein [Rhodanobacteraceae bacterium]
MRDPDDMTLEGRGRPGGGNTTRLQLPGVKLLPPAARKRLRRQVLAVLSRDAPAPDYDAPPGDPGLFGPDSATWKIHADFPSMMAGGLASLMLQALHPLALAGVWDHSAFRTDTLGRLRNTTAFVGRTTYAPRAPAEAAIEHVRAIHRSVRGFAEDGRAYSAGDPHLLAWVHCAGCWCFLRAYERYCHAPIPRVVQDRYLAEMVRIAEALGAHDVPRSTLELDAFFARVRPELVFDARTRETLRILGSIRLPIPFAGFSRDLFLGSAAALLPAWALDLMGRSNLQRLGDRSAARALQLIAPSVRDAMAEGGLAWRACRRTGADYAALYRWGASGRPVETSR